MLRRDEAYGLVEARLVTLAAARAEAAISLVRALFCLAVMCRFIYLHLRPPWAMGQALLVQLGCVAGLLAVVLFSLWSWHRVRRGPAQPKLLAWSIVLDATICALSLLQTVLGPTELHYRGILCHPDIATQLVMVMATGLRLSPHLAVLGGVLNAALGAGIIATDWVVQGASRTYGVHDVSMYGLMLGVTIVGAVVVAVRTRALVGAAARETARVEHARSQLVLVAQSQHDAKSLLAAALLRMNGVRQGLEELPGGPRSSEIERDLEALRSQLEGLGALAYGELMALSGLQAVDVRRVLTEALPLLRYRFRGLDITVWAPEPLWVHIVGGEEAIQRIVYELVHNAVDGDGTRGAQHIQLRLRRAGQTATLAVEDDGPGFALGAGGLSLTTKAGGQGLGLRLVGHLVEASQGQLDVGRSEALAGACVRLALPLQKNSVEGLGYQAVG